MRFALRERHVQLDPRFVGFMDDGGFRHVAFQLSALRGEQVTARGVLTQNFAGSGDLESLRHGFPGLAARYCFRHKARKIDGFRQETTGFLRQPGCVAEAQQVGNFHS